MHARNLRFGFFEMSSNDHLCCNCSNSIYYQLAGAFFVAIETTEFFAQKDAFSGTNLRTSSGSAPLVDALQHDKVIVQLGAFGLVCNVFAAILFGCSGQGHGHSHGGGHSHAHGHGHGGEGKDLNRRGVVLHLLSDCLTSAIMLVSGLINQYIRSRPSRDAQYQKYLQYVDPLR